MMPPANPPLPSASWEGAGGGAAPAGAAPPVHARCTSGAHIVQARNAMTKGPSR